MNDEIQAAPASEEDLRKQAVASLHRKRGFKQTLFAYLVVNALLIGIWAVSGAGYFWPAWVIVWWGFALAIGTASRPLRPRWGRAALRPPR